ncbi:hypothetical protein D0Z70_13930 [Sphingobium terrigena]|uniref:Uncharacterized protein n=2 Tax=Sphingobium terrigena TaxID=2304063 RepID=A0A418YRI1_9SPHN|nr:hypothetical protein D0Z70_13930 [Sphingobium terrigena]
MREFLNSNHRLNRALEKGHFKRAAELAIAANGGRERYIIVISCYLLEMEFEKAANYISVARRLYPSEQFFSEIQEGAIRSWELQRDTPQVIVHVDDDRSPTVGDLAPELQDATDFFNDYTMRAVSAANRASAIVSLELPTNQEVAEFRERCDTLTDDLGVPSVVGRPLWPERSDRSPPVRVHMGRQGPSDCLVSLREERGEQTRLAYYENIHVRAKSIAGRIETGGSLTSMLARFHLLMYCATFARPSTDDTCFASAIRELYEITERYGTSRSVSLTHLWMLFLNVAGTNGLLGDFVNHTLPLRERLLEGDVRRGMVAPKEMNQIALSEFDLFRILVAEMSVRSASVINLGSVQNPRPEEEIAQDSEKLEKARNTLMQTIRDSSNIRKFPQSKLGRISELALRVVIFDITDEYGPMSVNIDTRNIIQKLWKSLYRDRWIIQNMGDAFCDREIFLSGLDCAKYKDVD